MKTVLNILGTIYVLALASSIIALVVIAARSF